jgi:hypothetical protein
MAKITCHSERSVRIQNNLIQIHYDFTHLFLDPYGHMGLRMTTSRNIFFKKQGSN